VTDTAQDQAINNMYTLVARQFADRIENIFASEGELQFTWERYFPGIPFDRTDKWNFILQRELTEVWQKHGPVVKASLTSADRAEILDHLVGFLDYNLFSQVLLNLQDWALIRYRVADVEKDTQKLQEKWHGQVPSPFDAKPKMFKQASSPEQLGFNQDLSALKAFKIIAAATPSISFRVSPVGSTPALVDSTNLSMLGVGGDQYLVPPDGWKAFYFTWDQAPEIAVVSSDGSKFKAKGIPYPFVSKSGGDILNSSLAARKLATGLYAFLAGERKVILPRLTSVLLLTDTLPFDPGTVQTEMLPDLLRSMGMEDWLIQVSEGRRVG
jgi:hypothetical protein